MGDWEEHKVVTNKRKENRIYEKKQDFEVISVYDEIF